MNSPKARAKALVLAGSVLLGASVAHAQGDASNSTTRAALIVAEQAEKAKHLRPYTPNRIERRVISFRQGLIERPSGLYPLIDSVYAGGGFTLGAGYRQFYGDRTYADVKGLYSIKSYKLVEVSTDSWGHAAGRLDLHARAGWRDATEVKFFGVGIESPKEFSNFRLQQKYLGGNLTARLDGPIVFGAAMEYDDYSRERGNGSSPSIDHVHTAASAPGLSANPTYLHTTASAGIDWRQANGYSRRGGLYSIAYNNYSDRDDTYSFDRLDGDLVQHIPILRENWVISLRGRVQTTLNDDDIVPFFLLPSLGGSRTLRGYRSFRFRDRHSLLLSAEWRWIPNRLGLDMALFYDAGKVTPRWDDLSLRGMKSDTGIGMRFHGPLTTPVRIEIAKGSEGLRFVIASGAAF